jgi:hypothetical protein
MGLLGTLCGLAAGTLAALTPAEAFEGKVRQISLSIPTATLEPLVMKLQPADIFLISDERMAEAARQADSGARVIESVIMIDGERFRVGMNINGKDGFMLVDSAAGTTSIVVPEDKMYLQWTAADRAAAATKAESQGKAADLLREQAEKLPEADRERLKAALGDKTAPTAIPAKAPLTKRDKMARVNGALSEGYELRIGDQVSWAWVTQEHPDLLAAFRAASAGQQNIRPTPPTAIERFAEAGLPMRVQTVAGDRYEQVDLVEITPETIADADMQVPEGFTRVDPNANATAAPAAAATPAPPTPVP